MQNKGFSMLFWDTLSKGNIVTTMTLKVKTTFARFQVMY